MPKSYEDEIRDLLRGMDRFPGESGPPPKPRRRAWFSWRGFGGGLSRPFDMQRIMGGALILMLFAWILGGWWAQGYPLLQHAAGYISLISMVLFVVALVMAVRAGSFGRGYSFGGPSQTRWRGQVIQMPRRGSPL